MTLHCAGIELDHSGLASNTETHVPEACGKGRFAIRVPDEEAGFPGTQSMDDTLGAPAKCAPFIAGSNRVQRWARPPAGCPIERPDALRGAIEATSAARRFRVAGWRRLPSVAPSRWLSPAGQESRRPGPGEPPIQLSW